VVRPSSEVVARRRRWRRRRCRRLLYLVTMLGQEATFAVCSECRYGNKMYGSWFRENLSWSSPKPQSCTSAAQAVEAAARKAAAEEADTPMTDADAEEGALPGPPAGALSVGVPIPGLRVRVLASLGTMRSRIEHRLKVRARCPGRRQAGALLARRLRYEFVAKEQA